MQKIAIVTDTASDIDIKTAAKYNIEILPFRIIYNDREYKDQIDITSEDVYSKLEQEIPKSSLPSLEDVDNLFNSLENRGYTHVIVITISAALSGIYNAVRLVSENYSNLNIFTFDSKLVSEGEGYIAVRCSELLREGKTFEEIVEVLPKIQEGLEMFFVVGTLEYLKKGGRIGRVAGSIGELLNLKPIISVDKSGVYYTVEKVRGRKQSLSRMINLIEEKTTDFKAKVHFKSGRAEEEARGMCDKVCELENITKCEYLGSVSPVVGMHTGPGTIGFLIIREEI
jgi:DegV family protein with EDD domain